MYTRWNVESINSYERKVSDLLAELSACPYACSVHIGTGNTKTRMVNEGTSAGVCGTCDGSCVGDCREGCYAIVHGDGIYKEARIAHAENTIVRRNNPTAYYETFFAYAFKKGKGVRINETGDFETVEDVTALMAVAKKYPSVRVIGYTKRANLLSAVADLNKLANVCIHFSLACNGMNADIAERFGVPVTKIVFNMEECNCPNQIAKSHGKNHSCQSCARLGIGCFKNQTIRFFAH